MRKDEIVPRDYGNLLDRVATIFTQARCKAIQDINLTQVMAYYERQFRGHNTYFCTLCTKKSDTRTKDS
ncbi:MAG TPA: hypothetical protein VJZ49_00365 [Syntrophales bacterium]|nr:hypothetical protein [Syntrophales bacterium]